MYKKKPYDDSYTVFPIDTSVLKAIEHAYQTKGAVVFKTEAAVIIVYNNPKLSVTPLNEDFLLERAGIKESFEEYQHNFINDILWKLIGVQANYRNQLDENQKLRKEIEDEES